MARSRFLGGLTLACVLLVVPAAEAQEATISGTITDSTGGVLPGVVVTAVHEASGNTFEAVTDSAGGYRLSVRIGTYRLRSELPGFAPLERGGLQLQVGQQAVINLQMAPATLQESVTVTADAPLIDVTQSNLGSTIGAEQVENLPLNGRNWVDLTLLSPGSKQNFIAETPATSFQLNVDGQQVTQLIATTFGQPRFSKDTIAEFEVSPTGSRRQGDLRASGERDHKSGTKPSRARSRATSARQLQRRDPIPTGAAVFEPAFHCHVRRPSSGPLHYSRTSIKPSRSRTYSSPSELQRRPGRHAHRKRARRLDYHFSSRLADGADQHQRSSIRSTRVVG